MSRIGKKPIIIPKGVDIKLDVLDAKVNVNVKGPKGTLDVVLPKGVKIEALDDQLILSIDDITDNKTRAFWGLARNLVNNAVVGVTEGFSKTLEINGVGFKANAQNNKLILNVGFSHPVEYPSRPGIVIETEKNVIKISGIDKQMVGQTAAEIRKIKKPEPYKGKGIKYSDEVIRRKAGKVVKS